MAGKLAGGGKKKGFSTNAEPNVIPFIDIMLVMLIIFMVASPKPTVDIKVDLPPPGPAINVPTENKPTFVNLEDENGVAEYYVEGERVEIDQLEARLLKVVPLKSPGLFREGGYGKVFLEGKVYVDADQDTDYSNVIDLMNEIDKAGFKKVSLVAEEAQF